MEPIDLQRREAEVTNLNLKPERHGTELEERCDLNFSIFITDDECDEILRTRFRSPKELLWDDKGEPELRDLPPTGIPLAVSITGELTLALISGDFSRTYKAAQLKKFRLVPSYDFTAKVYFQARIEPDGSLDELSKMTLDRRCLLQFRGARDPEQNQLPGMEDGGEPAATGEGNDDDATRVH